jgi:hypothetical protein
LRSCGLSSAGGGAFARAMGAFPVAFSSYILHGNLRGLFLCHGIFWIQKSGRHFVFAEYTNIYCMYFFFISTDSHFNGA